ncbi:MAG: plasmid stabilization protein [Planctomycetia bacterium]|nr:plasmid stabilization protein [Planctomycetia bacterium]
MRTLIWSKSFTRACSVGYDLRIIFDFVKSETQKEEDIFLIGIGTHDEVY